MEALLGEKGERLGVGYGDVGQKARARMQTLQLGDGARTPAFALVPVEDENADLIPLGEIHRADRPAAIIDKIPALIGL